MATILIIDDEKEICDLLEDVFKQEKGFAVLKTDNGEDGVEFVKSHRPDVILLDIKLQVGMDGVDVLKEVRKYHPNAKVIVMTGYVEEVMERTIKNLGVDGYLEKPFTPPQILDVVKSVLKRKWAEGG